MAKNANYVSHKKSRLKNQDGSPQLPSASALVEGEIAINFAENVETLSIKNESGHVVTFSSDNYYTDKKLGSGFTGANSAVTVTEALENVEIDVDQDFSNTASTNPISTKAVYSAVTDNELAWTNAFVALSGAVSSHTVNTNMHITSADRTKLDSITSAFGTMAYEDKASYSSATEVNTALSSLSGKTVTAIGSSNSSISANTIAASDGTVKYDVTTEAGKISGLTAVSNSDEGAAKISGVSTTDSVKTGIKRLYDSLASEIAARKAAILARTITSNNKGITVSETPNADGFNTTVTLNLDNTSIGTGVEKTGNDNALTITDNGLFLSSSWLCGNF